MLKETTRRNGSPPAFWDIQTNGRWGISFADPRLTIEQVDQIVQRSGRLGNRADLSDAHHGPVRLVCSWFADDRPGVRIGCGNRQARSLGIHIEGPWISERDGYRGAHPLEAVRDPDWDEFRRFRMRPAGGSYS